MIKLGGNISLEGFETLDRSELLIIKKLVGNYIHDLQEKISGEINTTISLNKEGEEFSINVRMSSNDKNAEATAKGTNVFMTLDTAMKEALKGLE